MTIPDDGEEGCDRPAPVVICRDAERPWPLGREASRGGERKTGDPSPMSDESETIETDRL